MAETRREFSKRKQKVFRKSILIPGIPVIIFAIIIFFNNRDYFSIGHNSSSDISKKPDQPQMVNQISAESKKNDSINQDQDSFKKPFVSQKIPVSDCVISNRPDIRLNLVIEIIYENREMSSEILIRKNDIQTMVKSVLIEKELGEIKKELLRKELIEAINSIFGMNVLTDINFRSFQIEKVESI